MVTAGNRTRDLQIVSPARLFHKKIKIEGRAAKPTLASSSRHHCDCEACTLVGISRTAGTESRPRTVRTVL